MPVCILDTRLYVSRTGDSRGRCGNEEATEMCLASDVVAQCTTVRFNDAMNFDAPDRQTQLTFHARAAIPDETLLPISLQHYSLYAITGCYPALLLSCVAGVYPCSSDVRGAPLRAYSQRSAALRLVNKRTCYRYTR